MIYPFNYHELIDEPRKTKLGELEVEGKGKGAEERPKEKEESTQLVDERRARLEEIRRVAREGRNATRAAALKDEARSADEVVKRSKSHVARMDTPAYEARRQASARDAKRKAAAEAAAAVDPQNQAHRQHRKVARLSEAQGSLADADVDAPDSVSGIDRLAASAQASLVSKRSRSSASSSISDSTEVSFINQRNQWFNAKVSKVYKL